MSECKYCGEDGLHWEEIGGRWYLFDEEEARHTCGPDLRPSPADEFPMPEPTDAEWSEGEST